MQCQKCGTTKPPLYYHIINYQTMEYIRLCKQCHNEEHGLGLKLVEIFEEHTPIVKGGSQYGRYQADFIIVKKPNPPRITETELGIYVERLKQRYPSEGFYLRKIKWHGKTLHVIGKRKRNGVTGRVLIYFDLESQKFYVDKRDLEKNEKLANFIIMTVLGALKQSQSKYLRVSTRTV
jgi:hypothetical protein